jgi:hypothetical protein
MDTRTFRLSLSVLPRPKWRTKKSFKDVKCASPFFRASNEIVSGMACSGATIGTARTAAVSRELMSMHAWDATDRKRSSSENGRMGGTA